jgi:putative phage-type endonuclease
MPLSPEQLEVRRTGITASEIAAVAGICPYATKIDVWQRKMGVDDTPQNFHMERGTYLEPAIIEWAAARHDWRVAPAATVVHPDHPLVIATPDGIVADKATGAAPHAVLEVKCPSQHTERAWGEVGTDAVPDHYRAQVTWQMAATGLRTAYVVALMSGDVQLYEVTYNARLFDALLGVAKRFWNKHVEPCEPPPPDGSAGYDEYLAKLFPQRDPEDEPEEDEGEKAHKLVREFAEADELLRQVKQAQAAAKQRLVRYIGTRAGLSGEYGKVYYRHNKNSECTDWKAVARAAGALPSLIAEHTTSKPGARVLRAYLEKGE